MRAVLRGGGRALACTKEVHVRLKADYARFIRGTVFIGVQDLCDGTEAPIRNCRLCGSSLIHPLDVRARAA